jgi:hypothetical protein
VWKSANSRHGFIIAEEIGILQGPKMYWIASTNVWEHMLSLAGAPTPCQTCFSGE